jgi:hypothetical protein
MAEFAPTTIACPDDAVPDTTELPATVTVAPSSSSVGVMVMDDTAFFTSGTVYAVVVDEKVGVSVPELNTSPLKSTSTFTDVVLVTSTVYVVLAEVGVS